MMKTLPDLELLNVFLAVAHARSVSDAAVKLGRSQPTVSLSIRKLEDWASSPLFDRSRRPLSLTDAGRSLLDEAGPLVDAARGLADRMRDKGKRRRDRLRIGMPDSLSEIMGAEILGAIGGLAGQVELKSGISPWLESAFHERLFDLAVDMAPLGAHGDAASVALFNDPYVIAAPPGIHPGRIDETLEKLPIVGYGRTSKFGTECTAIAGRLGYADEPRFAFDSTQSLLRFVQAGYGWAITSAFCLFQSPQALEKVVIVACPESRPRQFSLLYRSDETGDMADQVALSFQRVFNGLCRGPWHRMAPQTVAMILDANAERSPETQGR